MLQSLPDIRKNLCSRKLQKRSTILRDLATASVAVEDCASARLSDIRIAVGANLAGKGGAFRRGKGGRIRADG